MTGDCVDFPGVLAPCSLNIDLEYHPTLLSVHLRIRPDVGAGERGEVLTGRGVYRKLVCA